MFCFLSGSNAAHAVALAHGHGVQRLRRQLVEVDLFEGSARAVQIHRFAHPFLAG